MSASNVFLTLASNVLSHVVFPLLEITKTPPTQLFPSFDISGAGGKLSRPSSVGCNPCTRSVANAIASLHTFSSCLRHRMVQFESCNFFAPCAINPARSCLYCGDFETSPSFSLAVFNTSSIIRSLAIKTLIRAAFPVVDRSIFFFTDTRDSFRSYSLLIFCFSTSTICNFSMLNSSSAATRISFAFSSASCLMNSTIWFICFCTSVSSMMVTTFFCGLSRDKERKKEARRFFKKPFSGCVVVARARRTSLFNM
mmetsp:Transcript_6592/g.19707  ORF Transcript_6592/g.19707 Transcript_6592/m.19707 type:complete len:254 (-) Transcript_6592:28-789(-)